LQPPGRLRRDLCGGERSAAPAPGRSAARPLLGTPRGRRHRAREAAPDRLPLRERGRADVLSRPRHDARPPGHAHQRERLEGVPRSCGRDPGEVRRARTGAERGGCVRPEPEEGDRRIARTSMKGIRTCLVLAGVLLGVLLATGPASAISVVSLSLSRLGIASRTSPVTITFDRAVDHASITADSFRVFSKQSGTASGPFTFSPDDTAVTLTPSRPFLGGEVVHVNLS